MKENERFISYEELYQNVYNPNWKGWRDVIDIMTSIESKGSRSIRHKDSRVLHALEFLNNHFVEEKVKEILSLQYLGDDHEVLYDRVGAVNIPDFIDENGETYELKSRWCFEDVKRINWNGADHCLFYYKATNFLYEYYPETGAFVPITYFRAKYVNTKAYPFKDNQLG